MDNAKNNKANFVLYIVLALIIVAVVCMTVFSIVTGSKRNGNTKVPVITDTAKPDKNGETTITHDNKPTEPDESKTTVNDNSEADQPDKDASAPVMVNITTPVSNGWLLKGYDIDMPVYSLTMNDYRVHTGVDILSSPGEPVMAIADGTVQNIYNDPMMGNCISISHSGGLVSYYMGLSDEVCDGITEGAPVFCGQNISSIGDSTLIEIAEEPHLHFELKKDGQYVDPMGYFSYKSASDSGRTDEQFEG